MVALLACVLANILVVVSFKMFFAKGINSFVAIVVNYWVCLILGSLVVGHIPIIEYQLETPWVPFALVLGLLFISGFNIAAQSVKYTGIAVTAVMQKMSLIISSAFAIIFFHESTGFFKMAGIALTVLAVILINIDTTRESKSLLGKYFIYPFLTLLFSGAIESILYHVQATELSLDADAELTTFAFSTAAIIGACIVLFQYITGRQKFQWKDYVGGLCLGIPNFFSIYLILVLLQKGFEGSVVFPVLNISVLVMSAIVGLIAFRERMGVINYIGIIVALLAIISIMVF